MSFHHGFHGFIGTLLIVACGSSSNPSDDLGPLGNGGVTSVGGAAGSAASGSAGNGAVGSEAAGASGASAGVNGGSAGASGSAGQGGTSEDAGAGGQSGGASGAAGSSAGGSAGAGGSSAGGTAGVAGSAASSGGGSSGEAAGGGGSGGSAPYRPCPSKGTPCSIMPMGDSITEGFRTGDYGGYRSRLFHLALTNQKSITFVGSAPLHRPARVDGVTFPQQNEGVGGRRINDLIAIVPDTIVKNRPHIVLLAIGTNDITSGAARMSTELATLLDKLLAADPQMLLVLATVIPTTTDSKTEVVEAYDALMPALVKARADAGKHIILVDMFAAFTKNSGYKTAYFRSTDDLHPTDAGASLMADVWYAGVAPYLP